MLLITQNTKKKHCLALVYENLRGKLNQSDKYIRDISLRLFAVKDHEKVLDVVAKVENRHARTLPMQVGKPTTRGLPSNSRMRCLYSGNIGYF